MFFFCFLSVATLTLFSVFCPPFYLFFVFLPTRDLAFVYLQLVSIFTFPFRLHYFFLERHRAILEQIESFGFRCGDRHEALRTIIYLLTSFVFFSA